MSVVDLSTADNLNLDSEAGPEVIAEQLDKLSTQLRRTVCVGAEQGESLDHVERQVWQSVQEIGFKAVQLFASLQGDGDLGETVNTEEGKTLKRSTEPSVTKIRTIFGEIEFSQWTYSAGKNKQIELRPISARMSLPEGRWSYFLEEFSQLFCVESAFRQAASNLGRVLGGRFSVDTLEQTSRRMGRQADEFLDALPQPDPETESELLVASADCKGVPLVKADAAKVAAFETAKKRPGNRRMATVASLYSIDPHFRTPEQIVEALFREEPEESDETESETNSKKRRQRRSRARPHNKNTTAHMPTIVTDGDQQVRISGIHEGMAWLADQVDARRQPEQTLLLLMDGQESLWETASVHLDFDTRTIGILDFVHVTVYVWEASGLFFKKRDQRFGFVKERLLRLLRGEVGGVIRGLRRMGSLKDLKGKSREDLDRICGYFEKHAERMRYDEYLNRGYPIASGVIEGACRHLVKDRMERSGMRWSLEGARAMLNVRAAFQSDHWDAFLSSRRDEEVTDRIHPHRTLVGDYAPLQLAC
jgi:hypothetical protein